MEIKVINLADIFFTIKVFSNDKIMFCREYCYDKIDRNEYIVSKVLEVMKNCNIYCGEIELINFNEEDTNTIMNVFKNAIDNIYDKNKDNFIKCLSSDIKLKNAKIDELNIKLKESEEKYNDLLNKVNCIKEQFNQLETNKVGNIKVKINVDTNKLDKYFGFI